MKTRIALFAAYRTIALIGTILCNLYITAGNDVLPVDGANLYKVHIRTFNANLRQLVGRLGAAPTGDPTETLSGQRVDT